jgi:hypothetical protein
MVHRLALLLGALGATGVLALSLGLGGLFAAAPVAADPGTADRVNQPSAAATTRTVIDKVYVEATPKPAVVRVNKPPRNKGSVATTERPREDERERGDRDESGEDQDRPDRGDD